MTAMRTTRNIQHHDHQSSTTRSHATTAAASQWIDEHPEIAVGAIDLAKTLQQLTTEILQTGRQRGSAALTNHAAQVLAQARVEQSAFRSARTFPISADIPEEMGAMFFEIARVLAPLAAGIQLARIPVTNAAERRAFELDVLLPSSPRGLISRLDLRGFVVSRLRPRAQEIHARIGGCLGAAAYRDELLQDLDDLAQEVVDAALSKRTAATTLSPMGAQRLRSYLDAHLPRLQSTARRHFGPHGDEVVSRALLKLAVAFRSNPGLVIDDAYGTTVVRNEGRAYLLTLSKRATRETAGSHVLETLGASHDDTLVADVHDLILRRVLTAAASLARDGIRPGERTLARDALLRYFLTDHTALDARRAALAPRVLALIATDGSEVMDGLRGIAEQLAESRAAAARVAALAIRTLQESEAA
jgi:hypothetical protein